MSAKVFNLLTKPLARRLCRVLRSHIHSVIPAKSGIQKFICIGSRLRGNDRWGRGNDTRTTHHSSLITNSSLPTHRLISINDAAKYIGVSPDTLRNWEKAGKLTPLRTQGGQRRYCLRELNALIANRQPVFYQQVKDAQHSVIPGANPRSRSFQNDDGHASSPGFWSSGAPPGKFSEALKRLKTLQDTLAWFKRSRVTPFGMTGLGDKAAILLSLGVVGVITISVWSGTGVILGSKRDARIAPSNDSGQARVTKNVPSSQVLAAADQYNFASGVLSTSDESGNLQLEITVPTRIEGELQIGGKEVLPASEVVSSLQGKVGALKLIAGTDMSIDGLTITNSSKLDTVRGRGGCSACITNADVADDLTLSGGTINSTPIGASSASTGAFTTISASSTLTVSGASTLSSTLSVTGATTLSSTLAVNGNATLGDASTDTVILTGRVASDIIPSADGTYALGSASLQWSKLYLSGVATIGGQSTFTSLPTGTAVGDGVIYINPASATGDYTLFGIAVGGTEKLRMDANGNITVQGTVIGASGQGVGYWQRSSTTVSPATANDIVSYSSDNTTNAFAVTATGASSNAINFTADSVTTGNGLSLSVDGLTTGNGLSLTSTSTAGGASGTSYLLNLARSGTNANASHTAYGLYSAVTDTGTTSTNVAGYFSASGATTNYGLQVAGGQSIFSVNGAASTPPVNLTGTWFTGGDATTTKPQLLIEPSGTTSTGWYTNGTGLGINAPSGASTHRMLIDAQQAGTRVFGVLSDGNTNHNMYIPVYISAAVHGGTMTFRNGGSRTILKMYNDSHVLMDSDDQGGASSANYGMLSIGGYNLFDGSTAGYFVGSSNGTELAVNARSVFTGNLIDAQLAGTSRFVVQSGGNVGIGTATPSTKLDIVDTSNTANGLLLTNNTATTLGASSSLGVANLVSTSLTTGALLNLELTEGTLAGGYYLRGWDATGGAAVFTVGEDGNTTIAGLEGSNMLTLTAGDAVISDGSLAITDDDDAAGLSVTNNTATTIGAGINTAGVVDISSTSLTTGNLMNLETTTTLTTGKVFNISSTATALTSGSLFSSSYIPGTVTTGFTGNLNFLDYSPTAAPTTGATGDILRLNLGANATNFTGNILNVVDASSSVFSVSKTTVTSALPFSETAPGDVSIAYDLVFSNPTASFINSQASLNLAAGESFDSSNLVLSTYNQGSIVFNPAITTGTGLDFTNATLTTGVGMNLSSTTLTTGKLVNIAPTFAGAAVTGYGQYINGADSTTSANTDYNLYSTLALTGAAAKTGVGLYSTVTSSSTTGDTMIAADLATSSTGVLGATTRSNYGLRSIPVNSGANINASSVINMYGGYFNPQSTGPTTGTTTVYGGYFKTLATHAADAGTVNQFGLYVANDATASTNGASTKYGLYVESPTGADTNYAAIFAGGNVGIGTTTPAALLDVNGAVAIGGVSYLSYSGSGSIWDAVGTTRFGTSVFSPLYSSAVGAKLKIQGGGKSSDHSIEISPPIYPGTAEASAFTTAPTQATNVAGNFANQRLYQFNNLTLNADGTPRTIDNGATVYINGAITAGTNLTISNNYSLWVDSGASRFDGPVALGAQATLTANSTTPSVADSSHFVTANTTDPTLISNFTSGHNGQILVVELGDSVTDFDCTSSNLNCGGADITTGATGDIFTFVSDGTNWNLINWMDTSATQTGADLSELYVSEESLEAGDIVSVPSTSSSDPLVSSIIVEKSKTSYDRRAIGIVSTKPGIVLRDGTETGYSSYPIALSGRVPVKVSTENGPIEKGDYLTSSSTPGVAMKATKPGQVIGKALEDYGGDCFVIENSLKIENCKLKIGRILAFANTAFADPQGSLSALDPNTLDSSSVLGLTAPYAAEDSTDLTIDKSLTVLGKTNVGDLGVTGNMTVGLLQISSVIGENVTLACPKSDSGCANAYQNDNSVTLNVLGTLKFQDAFGDGVSIDQHGNVKIAGSVTAKKYNVDTTDTDSTSLGSGVIPAGATSVTISTTAVTSSSAIFVTPETKTSRTLAVTEKISGKSFKVEITETRTTDLKFKWLIVN